MEKIINKLSVVGYTGMMMIYTESFLNNNNTIII